MDRVPFLYNHSDVPELAPMARVMLMCSMTPIVYGAVCAILCTTTSNGDKYLPFVLLFIIPVILMLFIAKRKLDQMYDVAKSRGVGEARGMFGKSMVAVVMGEMPAIVLLVVLVLLIMA